MLLGAVFGAAVGLVVGIIVHAIFGDSDSLLLYEVVAGLLGLVIGVALGAFYGGALNLPRNRTQKIHRARRHPAGWISAEPVVREPGSEPVIGNGTAT